MEGCKSGWVKPLSEETAQEMIKVLREFRVASELEEISNRLADRIFEDILKDIGLNEDIMEEKKTKKMTKAEAFEYLKEKKVYCYDGTNTLYFKLVKKLLACGCDYKGFMCPHNYSVSALAIDREGRVGHVPTEVFERYINLPFEAISADDILSIEIVEEKNDDERKGEILDEIAKLGEKISDLIEEYEGDIIIEIDQYEVLLRNSGDILYRK